MPSLQKLISIVESLSSQVSGTDCPWMWFLRRNIGACWSFSFELAHVLETAWVYIACNATLWQVLRRKLIESTKHQRELIPCHASRPKTFEDRRKLQMYCSLHARHSPLENIVRAQIFGNQICKLILKYFVRCCKNNLRHFFLTSKNFQIASSTPVVFVCKC